MYLDINSFQYIMKQILSSGSDDELELIDEQLLAKGYRSSITPLRNSGKGRCAQQRKTNNKYVLMKRMKESFANVNARSCWKCALSSVLMLDASITIHNIISVLVG